MSISDTRDAGVPPHESRADIPDATIDWTRAWSMHTIDSSSSGADGVKLGDVNSDGQKDLVVGWEEEGVIKAYLNPGWVQVKSPWEQVLVTNNARSVEGVALGDLDKDGRVDVVGCTEGMSKKVFVAWAPASYADARAWVSDRLPAPKRRWMDAFIADVDGDSWPDIVVGGKRRDAKVAWLRNPGVDQATVRNTAKWEYYAISDVGWTMTLAPLDVDGDGDDDIVLADRTPPFRPGLSTLQGLRWLENPGQGTAAQRREWANHSIVSGLEMMFVAIGDLDRDGRTDLVAPSRDPNKLTWLRADPQATTTPVWLSYDITLPPWLVGSLKAAGISDVDGDGVRDIVITLAEGVPSSSQLIWGRAPGGRLTADNWIFHPVAGDAGKKFDDLRFVDLDSDGDEDVITCEEDAGSARRGLGVIWYENPR